MKDDTLKDSANLPAPESMDDFAKKGVSSEWH